MSYAIMRMQKLKTHQVHFSQNHNNRNHKNYSNLDIDHEKTKDNYHLIESENFNQDTNKIILTNYTGEKNIRKDAIKNIEIIFTSDKKFFDELDPGQEKKYFEKSLEFVKQEFGEKNIVSAVIHKDETTPHMHVNFVPMKDGKLTAKIVMGDRKNLEKLQDKYFESISKDFPTIERGRKKSLTNLKHVDLHEFKKETAEKIAIEQEKMNKKIEKYEENYKNTKRVKHIYENVKPSLLNKNTVTIEKNDLTVIANLAIKTETANQTINKLQRENTDLKSENKDLREHNQYLKHINSINSNLQKENIELSSKNKGLTKEKNELKEFVEKRPEIKKEFQQFQKQKQKEKGLER